MATDLFGKYFNNPTKAEIYTTLTCNGSSADETSFDIVGGEGVITDNANTLASIDLSDVHVNMSQYTSDMKILEPYSYTYIKGMSFGETVMSKSYDSIPDKITSIENWQYNIAVMFMIKYIRNGKNITKSLKFEGDILSEITFVDTINTYFEDINIPINCSYNSNTITFDSEEIGFEFWIDHFVVLYPMGNTSETILSIVDNWVTSNDMTNQITWCNSQNEDTPQLPLTYEYTLTSDDDIDKFCKFMLLLNGDLGEYLSINNIDKVYIYENLSKYIGVKKYRNGAMKGIVMTVTYPEFNAESIYDYQESLKIVHIVDRVEYYEPLQSELNNGNYIALRKLVDVIDTYEPIYDSFRTSCSCICSNCDNETKTQEDTIKESLKQGYVIGLNDFCKYATEHNMWSTIGQLYIRTSVSDDPSSQECKNLIHSFIIFNPNPFPVVLKYLSFV